ncbi:MAG: DotU family type IV/VI secretion system protein [Gammaproteobacteria bacterium]|nr:DotU family type IV/VI secretion system protein [Gammaproteobacteria bacterium]
MKVATSLLVCFAEVYEEIARIKLAIRDGRLPLYLGDGKEPVAANGNDLAAAVSQRLKSRLQQQARMLKTCGTEAEIEVYGGAQYAMVALADELFILEVDWPGRDAWQQVLLEQGLFGSSNAGRRFFAQLDELLKSRVQNPLNDDLAAVFLIALQLGFKGEYRGQRNAPVLKSYREKLIQFLGAGHATLMERPAFLQAYQYRISEPRGERLAPVSRWYRLAALGLLIYLMVSSVVWMALIQHFNDVLNGG